MTILFTGGSSFTGCWFVHELARRGHRVVCTFRSGGPSEYTGSRARRIATLLNAEGVEPWWGASFGDPAFISGCRERKFDVLCHHASEVTDYKSARFDWAAALSGNTRAGDKIFSALAAHGCGAMIYTGTYFEPDEGADGGSAPAVSPYGLSKKISWEVLRYFSAREGMSPRKFVVPTPVGPGEDERLLNFLIQNWRGGKPATLRTGNYVRDHVPAAPLARCYSDLVEQSASAGANITARPSGWVETVGQFARRAAAGVREALQLPCEVVEAEQTELNEPKVRHNSEALLGDWSPHREKRFWESVVEYYIGSRFEPGALLRHG